MAATLSQYLFLRKSLGNYQSSHVFKYFHLDCMNISSRSGWNFLVRRVSPEKDFTEKSASCENGKLILLFWGFLALCTKYFPWKNKKILKVKELCLQTSCEYLYFVVGWRMRMLVPRSIVWIQVLTVLWTCAVLQNLCYFWCEWHSQSFFECFESQSKDLHKKPYAGIPAGMHLCVQGQQHYCPLIFSIFSVQLCTWMVLVGVIGFRAISSYAQGYSGSTTGIYFFFGSCAVTCHHSWCCFYTAFVWGWANISRRWLLRTAFPWPCDSFNLGCVVFSRACPEVAENAWVQDRAERDPSSLKMVASFALYSQYPRPVPVTISSASYLQTS